MYAANNNNNNNDHPYTNGYGYDSNPPAFSRRRDLDAASVGSTSADERSRSRGPPVQYLGQRQEQDHDEYGPRVDAPAQLDRRHAHRRSADSGRAYGASRSTSRQRGGNHNPQNGVNGYGNGNGSSHANANEIEDILRDIDANWSFMSSDDCVPVKVALQLMDQSSLGLADQHQQFRATHQRLQNALKSIVNEHHQGFNSSIGTFHQIQASILTSQTRVRTLKQSLLGAKTNLRTSRPELKAFATSSQSYDHMLQTLAYIEQLQIMPEKLEAQISEKRFLAAVDTLQEALKLMRKPEMEEIGALADLRLYFSNQEHALVDILIEELHSHLYLKSPYCEDRWKPYAHRTAATSGSGVATTGPFALQGRPLYRFLDSLMNNTTILDDNSRNPEADTFSYIHLLVESLDRMSRLDLAVDAVEQRLPVELFRVVERANIDVEQRYPSVVRNATKKQHPKSDIPTDLDQDKKAILEDMLSTLYAKFEAIAEGHRVLHEVISRILKRQGVQISPLLRSFTELWKLYQSEIRSMLHDHLTTDGNSGDRSQNEINASTSLFKPYTRDKNKRLFKLADTDSKSGDLVSEREDLEFILKSSAPGLISAGSARADMKSNHDHKEADRSATGHRLLVEPSVFNMGILLPPSLAFLTRLKDVVPPSAEVIPSTLTGFLDDFLINVFYPQLEDTITDSSNAVFADLHAFREDPKWYSRAQKPVFSGISHSFDLVLAFCRLLDSLPHDQAFSQLIISQLRSFYDKCYSYYKTLVNKPQYNPHAEKVPKKAAVLAEYNAHMRDLVAKLLSASDDERPELLQEETSLLISTTKSQPLSDSDLILDRKALSGLCTLYTSARWFASHVANLRHISATMTAPSNSRHQNRRWTTLTTVNPNQAVYLPLDTDCARDFDAVGASFAELSSLVLRTLHLELRLQILVGVSKTLSANYALDQEYRDPDPAIVNLGKGLLVMDEDLHSHLPEVQYKHLTRSLSEVAETALIRFANMVPAMDASGNARMQLNILVLQQNLKDIEREASLSVAAQFWELFDEGPEAVVGALREGLVALEEAREMMRLWGSSRGDNAKRETDEAMKLLEAA
ncbi:hypothetical protein AAFC00_002928 [Neodothiora populina]|uniref:Exocyst complex component Sec8 n=1 Tax=Neodothiora populina TaxID=2781224 RepID=A0ABR3P8P0_9PEZI